MKQNDNMNILKEFKKEFLQYLEERIPAYRMPASKFFSSFNASLKIFARNHGVNISSILEIQDIAVLVDWLGKLGQNENVVFNARRRQTKAQEGLRYYINFLKSRSYNNPDTSFNVDNENSIKIDDDEFQKTTEGMMKEVMFFRRQRNRTIRNQCAERDCYTCQVCGFNFAKVYGERGVNFIEVHHLKPLSSYDDEHDIELDDLISLCSNCHSMIHMGGELKTPNELVQIIKEQLDKTSK